MKTDEQEIEEALRWERMEQALTTLTANLDKNTKSTEELVTAWNSAKWVLAFVKATALAAVTIAGGWTLLQKLWGH